MEIGIDYGIFIELTRLDGEKKLCGKVLIRADRIKEIAFLEDHTLMIYTERDVRSGCLTGIAVNENYETVIELCRSAGLQIYRKGR